MANIGALWDCGIRVKIHADWSNFVVSSQIKYF